MLTIITLKHHLIDCAVNVASVRFEPYSDRVLKPWLDSHGSFYSEEMRVIERWRLLDADTLQYEATVEDPAVFTQQWTMAFTMNRIKQSGYEFFEEACWEGVTNKHRLAAGRIAVDAGERRIHTHEGQK